MKLAAYREGDPAVVASVTRTVARVDYFVVAPSVVLQIISGYLLAGARGWSLTEPWLALSLLLYGVIGICWGVAIRAQLRMETLAEEAVESGREGLPEEYRKQMRIWLAVGVTALVCVSAIFVAMVYTPSL